MSGEIINFILLVYDKNKNSIQKGLVDLFLSKIVSS